ncbi:MAG: DUF3179 domain-containing protein, partial [Terriglobia bacterium]
CEVAEFSTLGQERDLLNAGTGQPPFDITTRSVPKEALHDGGPPKDGIPALDRPRFVTAGEAAAFLKDKDRVIGVYRNGETKAYPLKVMVWHELVNDEIEGEALAVSYCPLNGAGVAYHSEAGGKQLTFGVTGKIYNSTVVLYDRQTQSLWSQVKKEAIAGPSTGMKLEMIPSLTTTWRHWKTLHPETRVLSTDTGFRRDYNQSPYAAYNTSDELMFPVPENVKTRLRNKERVIGLEMNGVSKAYPFSRLKKKQTPFEDEVGGAKVQVHFDPKTETASVTDSQGNLLRAFTIFWFAWQAFHPETQVFE